MDINKLFKKKWSDKIQCSVCASKKIKKISVIEDMYGDGRVNLVCFTVVCENDHMFNIREWTKKDFSDGK